MTLKSSVGDDAGRQGMGSFRVRSWRPQLLGSELESTAVGVNIVPGT